MTGETATYVAGFSAGQLFLLGLTVLAVTFMLRRTVVLGRQSRSRNPLAEARRAIHEAEHSTAALFSRLEVRLHDYSREIEGRMETRIAMLNRLCHEADCEIERLQQVLEDARRFSTAKATVSPSTTPTSAGDAGDAKRDLSDQDSSSADAA